MQYTSAKARDRRDVAATTVIDLFERSAATFRSVLGDVGAQHHKLPTPCDPLDVSELIARAVGHQNWVRFAIHGESTSRDYPPIAPDEWMAAFDDSTASMIAELNSAGALERPVTLAAGLVFSGSDVAVLAARNIFQFAWDLAVGTGHDTDLSPELATELLEISRTHLIPQRGPNGFFGPEFVPAAGSPVATVLAGYLGREV